MDFIYKYNLFYGMLTHGKGQRQYANWLLNNNNNNESVKKLYIMKSRDLSKIQRLVSVAKAVPLSGTLLIKEGFFMRPQQTAKFVSVYFRHTIVVMWHSLCHFKIQVSLAICGGYVPEKLWSVNTKTAILGLNLWKFPCYLRVFTVFWPVNSQYCEYQIRKSENNEGRLYLDD